MHQLWLLLKNYHVVILFLGLELIALFFLFSRSDYQRASFLNANATVQAKVDLQRHSITQYFGLKEENEKLASENILLRDKLSKLQDEITTPVDTLSIEDDEGNLYHFKTAQVISNPLNTSNNHITINKGLVDGVEIGDGILSAEGIVGKVIHQSKNFSLVMPVFHPKSKINIKHNKSKYIGNLVWTGKSFDELTVENLARNANVDIGDTISTNQYSKSFPNESLVGSVKEIHHDASGNFYVLTISPAAKFRTLDYVYIAHRTDLQEIYQLENEIKE